MIIRSITVELYDSLTVEIVFRLVNQMHVLANAAVIEGVHMDVMLDFPVD